MWISAGFRTERALKNAVVNHIQIFGRPFCDDFCAVEEVAGMVFNKNLLCNETPAFCCDQDKKNIPQNMREGNLENIKEEQGIYIPCSS